MIAAVLAVALSQAPSEFARADVRSREAARLHGAFARADVKALGRRWRILVKALGENRHGTREAAQGVLERIGWESYPALCWATWSPDCEVRSRAREVLAKIRCRHCDALGRCPAESGPTSCGLCRALTLGPEWRFWESRDLCRVCLGSGGILGDREYALLLAGRLTPRTDRLEDHLGWLTGW